jgi:Flp pilus assembly protein TadG
VLKRNPILKNGKRGQSLVELAVSLPVMVLILLGTVDFGMAIFHTQY